MQQLITYAPLGAGLAAAGALAGLIAGLLGVGGGIVMVPAIALILGLLGFDPGVTQHVAVGTSLAVIIATGFSSARAHFLRGAVMPEILRLWAPTLVLAALLGGVMSRWYSGDVLRVVFGAVVLFLAFNIILPVQKKLMGRFHETPIVHRVSAFVIGYVSALMGVGGGSFSVPTLTAFGHPMHKAVGTSAAIGVMLAVPGALGFVIAGWGEAGRPPLSLGYVNLPALLLVGVVATTLAPVGASLAHRLDQRKLRLVFAAFLVVVGGHMLVEALAG